MLHSGKILGKTPLSSCISQKTDHIDTESVNTQQESGNFKFIVYLGCSWLYLARCYYKRDVKGVDQFVRRPERKTSNSDIPGLCKGVNVD